jgi:hypothetical protein
LGNGATTRLILRARFKEFDHQNLIGHMSRFTLVWATLSSLLQTSANSEVDGGREAPSDISAVGDEHFDAVISLGRRSKSAAFLGEPWGVSPEIQKKKVLVGETRAPLAEEIGRLGVGEMGINRREASMPSRGEPEMRSESVLPLTGHGDYRYGDGR